MIIAPNDKDTCLGCHSEKVNQKKFAVSAHSRLSCQMCHEGIDRFPHPEKAMKSKPQCTTCHAIKAASLSHSVHQHADKQTGGALACQACHGKVAHEIIEASKLAHDQQVAPCKKCHQDIAAKLVGSVHGVDGKLGIGNRPYCLFCHGSNPHEISPPKAATAPAKDASCRSCHTDIAKMLAGSAHGTSGTENGNRLSCLACHGDNPHAVSPPRHLAATEINSRCQSCHADIVKALASSAHGGAGALGKKSPTCVDCHGDNLHAIKRASQITVAQKGEACKTCHADIAKTLAGSVHGRAGAKGQATPTCLTCHWGKSHAISTPEKMDRLQLETACKTCHAKLASSLKDSVHDRPDRQAGDHPSCLSCHGGKAHAVQPPKHLTPKQRVALCSGCHNDEARMARYGMTTGAVSSYAQSFHGRAVMRFNQLNTATCTDCHGLHGVLDPLNSAAPTNALHVTATCGKCHAGAQVNFATSGANHLRLRIQSSPILLMEELFFQLLIFGTMMSLFAMVVLDLRRKAFSAGAEPEAGKFVSVLIAISILCLVTGIVLAFLHIRGVEWVWLTGIGLVVLALIAYAIRRKLHPHKRVEKVYPRFSLTYRIQHVILALTFTTLVLTGLPLHFADVEWLRKVLDFFGGFQSARLVHRVAGVTMVLNWVWHLFYLLFRWKQAGFTIASWTMLPTKKDVYDFIDYAKYLLGLRKELPRFDRFQFREKFDYYADIWGTIVMGATGFVMWFPTTLGNHLPDLAFGVSYIAHSYEGLLAMMAIIVWHFYNTHFNPDTFPMNPTWFTGTMTESEMAREHPLEKERLDAQQPRNDTPVTL